jgi:hypothetical protein
VRAICRQRLGGISAAMIYMVEMDFRNPAREADWHVWYLDHVAKLIRTVPGFRATQRFRAITPTPSPWLALHDVASPAVFESAEYRANGGPASTGQWQAEHTNWQRNLFAGIDATPEVPADGHLLVLEADAKLPSPHAVAVTWLESIGLDRSAGRRGIAVLPAGRLTAHLFGLAGVRIFKPISPRIAA